VKGVSYVRLMKNLTVIFLLLVFASRVSRADVTKLCVVPVDIKGGRGEEIRIFARDSMRGLFEKYGFQWIVLSSAGLGFTRETDMLKMGKESGCDLVLSATMEIKSKHGWHITGPRAKAEVTMSSNIVDVKGEKVIFNVMNKTADSKRKNLDQAAVAVFVSLGGAFLMGGSRAAQEKRAIANILTDVYEPFLTTQGRSIQSESRGTGVSTGQGPWVDFLMPEADSELSGKTTVELEVIGEVTEVKLLVDGKEYGTLTQPPFRWELDTSRLSSGDHILSCLAVFKDGIMKTSNITVKVKNRPTLP